MIALKSKEDYIERVLYTEEEIAARVKELSAQISEDYKDIAKPLLAFSTAQSCFILTLCGG